VKKIGNRQERFWGTKSVRVITMMTVLLMAGSLLAYTVWLSSGRHQGGLPEYLGVIVFILVVWAVGLAILRRRYDRAGETR
jgi:hypothetical protein